MGITQDDLEEELFLTYKVADSFTEFLDIIGLEYDSSDLIENYPSDFIEDSKYIYECLNNEQPIDIEDYLWYLKMDSKEMIQVQKEVVRTFACNEKFSLSKKEIPLLESYKLPGKRALKKRRKVFFTKTSLEEELNYLNNEYRLPESYTRFLTEYNGLIVDTDQLDEGLNIIDNNMEIYITMLYGIFTKNNINNLIAVNENLDLEIPKNYLIIGEDITNGFVLLDLNNPENNLLYWDITNFYRKDSKSTVFKLPINLKLLLEKIS